MKKLILFAALACLMAGCSAPYDSDDWGGEHVIPVSLRDIEAVNVDNSGEYPSVATGSVNKEAYMLGVKWIVDNLPTDNDKFVTDNSWYGERSYYSISDRYSMSITCLTQFNSDIPAGTYVSKYFKRIDRTYLPADMDEGFVLLVAPDPGLHSFRIEYYSEASGEPEFSYDTSPIEFR